MSELERTEQATPRKRQKERQKGNVAKSQDVVAAIGTLVATIALLASAKSNAATALEGMRSAFADGFELDLNEISFAYEASGLIWLILKKLAGFFLLIVFAGIVGNVLQTGFLILPKKALPDFKRLASTSSFKRFFSTGTVARTIGGIGKALLFALLVAMAIKRDAQTLIALPYAKPIEIVLFFSAFIKRVAYQFCALILLLAVVDYGIKRWKYERDIRMTRQELSDEIREESGSPQTRGKRREARSALMNSVTAISGTAPAFPVSPFQPKKDREKKEKDEQKKKRTR